MSCNYPDREAVLVAYLYDEIDTAERIAFDTHINTCFACRGELAGFRGLQSTLAKWAPPAPDRAFSLSEPRTSNPEPRAWWHNVPAWAQAAAAILVLGVSASIANLNVTYSAAQGLNVTTGWSRAAAPVAAQAAVDDTALRAELTALKNAQNELRSEIRTRVAAAAPVAATAVSQPQLSDAELRRRFQPLLEESEKRQDQELARHFVQLQQDLNAQRQGDIRRTNQILNGMMSTYGDTLTRQQGQINYLLPASQQR